MNTTTPTETARRLRAVAGLLAQAEPAPLTVHLFIDVSRYLTTLTETQRIAAVDAIASALGLTATTAKANPFWEHRAAQKDTGFHLSVSTDVEGPQMCACGATCTHAGRREAAA